jgi:Flp pilus assembly protein TadD
VTQEQTLAAFENALRLDPNNSAASAAYSYRGAGRLALGDKAGADSDFHKALSLDPGNRVAAMGLAKLQVAK